MGRRHATWVLLTGLVLMAAGSIMFSLERSVVNPARLREAGTDLYATDAVHDELSAALSRSIATTVPVTAISPDQLDQAIETALAEPALAGEFDRAWSAWIDARANGPAPVELDAVVVGTAASTALARLTPPITTGPLDIPVSFTPEWQPDPYAAARMMRVPAVGMLAVGAVLVVIGLVTAPSRSAAASRVARWLIGTALVLLALAVVAPPVLDFGGGPAQVIGALLHGSTGTLIGPALAMLAAGAVLFVVTRVWQRGDERQIDRPVTPLGRTNATSRA